MGSCSDNLIKYKDRQSSQTGSYGRSLQGAASECQTNPMGQSLNQVTGPMTPKSLCGCSGSVSQVGDKGSQPGGENGSQLVVDNMSWTIESPSSAWSTSTDASYWPLKAEGEEEEARKGQKKKKKKTQKEKEKKKEEEKEEKEKEEEEEQKEKKKKEKKKTQKEKKKKKKKKKKKEGEEEEEDTEGEEEEEDKKRRKGVEEKK
ncbi:hypothetical protein WDU94_000294 [Cyamophila willieti]